MAKNRRRKKSKYYQFYQAVKFRGEYILLQVVSSLVRLLPRSLALNLGGWLGRIAAPLMTSRYALARDNMVQALPDLSSAQVDESIRDNFIHFGKSAVEMLRLPLMQPEEVKQIFRIEGLEHLHEALSLERGVILMTGHLGFWEAGSYLLPAHGIPCDIVTKPMKNRFAEDFFAAIRQKYGATILNSKKGARRILLALKAGHAVAVLLDQHISPPGSVETRFFGRSAYTTTAITSMAMKHQIPIVPLFCLRNADNSYRAWVEPMILLDGEGAATVEENTQRLTDVIEAAIRQDVSQWFWMHRRWRVKSK